MLTLQGGLFAKAGLCEAVAYKGISTKEYKNGIKLRTDLKAPFTRHDMRRGFNLIAKEAGMSLNDRSAILGHAPQVNELHYYGVPQINVEQISRILDALKADDAV